jgi:hypothetical protein
MEMQKQAMVAQQNMKSQELAGQNAMQKIQAELQAKMQLKQAESQMDITKMEKEAELKLMLMDKEFNYNMQLAQADNHVLSERDKQKEDAKDKRISLQNSQQSKLIQQRKDNLPPLNFESNEDSLDGFDFAEFGPR